MRHSTEEKIMKKLMTITLAATMLLAAGVPSVALAQHHGGPSHGGPRGFPLPPPFHGSHGSHSGLAAAGAILTGVAIGSFLQSTCLAAPPRREVAYSYQTVYRQPTVVQEVRYVQPPEVRYVRPQVVIRDTVVKETVWVQNSNGSQTPVELRRSGNGQYIGPRGEYYMGLPSNDQLRQLYGM
jgi:hypothetical protein